MIQGCDGCCNASWRRRITPWFLLRMGWRAWSWRRVTPPDLVLLDLKLPAQNGWEIFERLTADNASLPIIIITARPNQIFPALASGAGALMEKPLDLPKLLRTIRDMLAEPAETRQARIAGQRAEFHYLPPKARQPVAKREERRAS